jgi:glyoxylate/succinic semialdehyde reductase
MQRILFLLCSVFGLSRSLRQLRSANHRTQFSLMSSVTGASPSAKSVGFIGLGLMGDGMARRLLASDFPLTVWNRSKPKCDSLKTDFESLVHVAESPAEVIARSDITFVMLSTPEATRSVYEGPSGMLSALKKGKSIVDCATLAPADMIWASKEVNQRGGLFVEGPVSGSKVPAEKGQLIFLLAGDQSLVDEIQPHLAQMGKANHFIGKDAGTATKMKLVVNAIMSNMLACLGEGMSLTADCGLSVDVLLQILGQGTMASPLISVKGPVCDSYTA